MLAEPAVPSAWGVPWSCVNRGGRTLINGQKVTLTECDDEDSYDLVGRGDAVFGGMPLPGCHDVCPEALAAAHADRVAAPQDGFDGLEMTLQRRQQ